MRKEDNAAWFFTHDNPTARDTDRADANTRVAMKTAVEVPLLNILDAAEEEKDLLQGYDAANGIKALEKCYGEYPVFDAAADTWLLETGNDHVLGIGRYYQGQKLLALFNFSDMTQSVWMHENERYTDLMDRTEKSAEYIRMASGSFLWLLLDYQK